MSGISPALSLLNAYDPTNPSSLDSSLTGAGLSDTYYQQGVAGTGPSDPGTQGPAAASTAPSTGSSATSSGLNVYQQSLASLQEWSAQTLITAALGGAPNANTSGDDSSALVSTLENAAEQQQAAQAAQQQAALSAAQSALDAGTNVDTTA